MYNNENNINDYFKKQITSDKSFRLKTNKKKNIIKNILSNKIFLIILSILIFFFVLITVLKTFYLRSVVDSYEEFFTVIENKESTDVIIGNDNDSLTVINESAANQLINCLKKPLLEEELSDEMILIINELNNYYNQSNNYFAFKYKDIYTGFTVSYNENQQIFAASTIKAPKDLYLYEMALQNIIDLNEKMTYTSNYYNTGTGILKNNKFNTIYTVKDLIKYSTIYSDNAAHNMLMDKYGRTNMLNYWKEKGTTSIFTTQSNWGSFNAHDAIIYMEELYNFYQENNIYSNEIMDNFYNAVPKLINGKNNYKVANKSGWSGSVIHDVSIIFAENPYILAVLSNLGDKSFQSYFNTANDFGYRIHTEYWKTKTELCNKINQY